MNLLGTVQEEGEEEEMEDSDSLGLGISPLQSMSFLNAPILTSSSLSALPHKPALLRRAVSMKVSNCYFLLRKNDGLEIANVFIRSQLELEAWKSWVSRDPLHPTQVKRGRNVEWKVCARTNGMARNC